MTKKYNLKDISATASLHKIKCMSEEYFNSYKPLKWMCENNHEFLASFSGLSKRQNWCKECVQNERASKLLLRLKKLANNRGGECLSNFVPSTKENAIFKCRENHQWSARVSSVIEGNWCKECGHDKQRIPLIEIQNIANERGGECLSINYKSVLTKIEFKCGNGHTWRTRLSSIKCGHWCPKCKLNMTRLEKAQKILNKQRWCLIKSPTDGAGNFQLKCSRKHIFSINVASVSESLTCKTCHKLEIASEKLDKFKQHIVSSDLNISDDLTIECEFKHLFKRKIQNVLLGSKPCPTCKKKVKIKNNTQKYSAYANKFGGKLLSLEVADSLVSCDWQCANGHVFKTTPRRVKNGFWCLACLKEKKILNLKNEIKKIIKSKKGHCLNLDEIKSLDEKINIFCEKKHNWLGTAKSVLNGRWCVKCQATKYSIDDFKVIASNKGGECLSVEYQNSHQRLKFICKNKHEWEAAAYTIARGAWCSVCCK